MNCILIRFAENAELRRVDGTPGGYADIQSGLDRLENWVPGNRLKLNTIKYPVLNLSKNLLPSTDVFVKSLEQHKGDINVFIFAISATSVQGISKGQHFILLRARCLLGQKFDF